MTCRWRIRKASLRGLASACSAFLLLLAGSPVRAGEVIEYYHLDVIGNVRAVTNAAGQVVERHDYLPFGEECTTGPCASNPALGGGQPRKFTGKERDPETGLDHFGARYYSSRVGRFTTTDPAYVLQANLLDPQRWNKYAYARNNPLRYTDPDGKFVLPLFVVVGVAAVYAILASPDIANAPGPSDPMYKSDQSGKLMANAALAVTALKAIFPTEGLSPPDQRDPREVHSRYGDGTPVFEGQRPARLPPGPDPDAGGPHTRLRRDTVNDRIYQGREFDASGNPVRDVDFTSPTYRSGRPRPDHHAAPHQHPWTPNSPENPKAGFKRGAAEPLGQ